MIRTLFPKHERFDVDLMMSEALEQMEFQFGWDEAQKAVDNAAEKVQNGRTFTKRRVRVQTRNQLLAQPVGPFVETWRSGFENGDMFVECRFVMTDPLDSDFRDYHSAFLENIVRDLPPGFQAEYDNGDAFDRSSVRGNKLVVGSSTHIESGPAGRDDYDSYDVVERLLISKK